MVSNEEILHIAKLMRIEIDPTIYERIEKMIGYFDILDSAGVENEELTAQEISIDDLREDVYHPYEDKIIEGLNKYKGNYFRAPKMI